MYRHTTDFHLLILYPATLLFSLVLSWWNQGFSLCKMIPCAKTGIFPSSFLIWIHFVSFSCLLALAIISDTMFNSSGEPGYPCLVHNLRGRTFYLSTLSMVLAVGLFFLYQRFVLSIPNFWRVLILNGCRIVSNAFFF